MRRDTRADRRLGIAAQQEPGDAAPSVSAHPVRSVRQRSACCVITSPRARHGFRRASFPPGRPAGPPRRGTFPAASCRTSESFQQLFVVDDRLGKIEQGGLVDDVKNRALRALSLGEPEGFAKPGFGGRAAVEGQLPYS